MLLASVMRFLTTLPDSQYQSTSTPTAEGGHNHENKDWRREGIRGLFVSHGDIGVLLTSTDGRTWKPGSPDSFSALPMP